MVVTFGIFQEAVIKSIGYSAMGAWVFTSDKTYALFYRIARALQAITSPLISLPDAYRRASVAPSRRGYRVLRGSLARN
jgi:hypothetical protein